MALKAKRICFRLDRFDEERLIKLKGYDFKFETSEIIRNALRIVAAKKDAEDAAYAAKVADEMNAKPKAPRPTLEPQTKGRKK